MINFNNHTISSITYNSHAIKKAYGCDGHLVWCEPQYRWVVDRTRNICSGYNYCELEYQQISKDCGKTWITPKPTHARAGRVIYPYCYWCGYVGTPKIKITLDSGEIGQFNCESTMGTSTENVLTGDEFKKVTDGLIHDDCDTNQETVEIGDCVEIIGKYVETSGHYVYFDYGCYKSINYGKNVIEVADGHGGASYCTGLTAVTLPPKITKINFYFNDCPVLKTMTIPSGVTSIVSKNPSFYGNKGVWENCTGLESLIFLPTSPPDLGEYPQTTFNNTNNCPIYVPAGSVNAYKTASGWSIYADRIQAIP